MNRLKYHNNLNCSFSSDIEMNRLQDYNSLNCNPLNDIKINSSGDHDYNLASKTPKNI